jgi:hypothetical protein
MQEDLKKRKRFFEPDLAVLHPRDQKDAAFLIMTYAESSLPE